MMYELKIPMPAITYQLRDAIGFGTTTQWDHYLTTKQGLEDLAREYSGRAEGDRLIINDGKLIYDFSKPDQMTIACISKRQLIGIAGLLLQCNQIQGSIIKQLYTLMTEDYL